MILDVFDHWKNYEWPAKRFRQAFEWLAEMKPELGDGRYELDGDNLFVMVQTYDTRSPAGHEFEAHRTYADIQYIIAGEERCFWAPAHELTVSKPYKPDAEMYELIDRPTELILLQERFAVFFPPDAHAPCVALGEPSRVRKAVVKVKVA